MFIMRRVWLSVVVVFVCCILKAQHLSVGASLGKSGYSGDLIPGSIDVAELNNSYGFHIRGDIGKLIALRACVQHLLLSADDHNYSTLLPYLKRSLAFQNDIWEFSLGLELNFLRFGSKRALSAAYLFGGVGAFSGKLSIQQDGNEVRSTKRAMLNEQVLRIEPQQEPLRGLVYPVGIGFKIFPSSKICLELRSQLNLGGGDYIDGASYEGEIFDGLQSDQEPLPGGFMKKNDLYFFTGLAFSIQII